MEIRAPGSSPAQRLVHLSMPSHGPLGWEERRSCLLQPCQRYRTQSWNLKAFGVASLPHQCAPGTRVVTATQTGRLSEFTLVTGTNSGVSRDTFSSLSWRCCAFARSWPVPGVLCPELHARRVWFIPSRCCWPPLPHISV